MFIVASDSKERLELQFVPFELSYSRNANHADFEVIGRNLPRVQYTGGKAGLILTIDFVSVEDDRTDVVRNCTWLESLAASNGYEKSQEKIVLVFGNLFRMKEWVIKDINIQYANMHGDLDFLPAEASVKLTLACVSDYNQTYDDIRYENTHKEIAYGALAPQVVMPELVDTSIVSENNPYANGEILEKEDGKAVLRRKKLMMAAKFVAKASYRVIVQGESIESVAYTSLRDQFPDAEKYWWILSDLNGMNGNPIDIGKQIGREILIPNVHEVLFSEAMKL